jgi:hypothetical protein
MRGRLTQSQRDGGTELVSRKLNFCGAVAAGSGLNDRGQVR